MDNASILGHSHLLSVISCTADPGDKLIWILLPFIGLGFVSILGSIPDGSLDGSFQPRIFFQHLPEIFLLFEIELGSPLHGIEAVLLPGPHHSPKLLVGIAVLASIAFICGTLTET